MFRVTVGVLLVFAAAGTAACGSDDDAEAAAGFNRPAGTVAPPPADAQALARLADKYLAAIGTQNFRAACQTRTLAEREAFARVAGSCPKAFATVSRTPGAAELKTLARSRARVAAIGLDGSVARIPLSEGDDVTITGTLTAKREGGRYRLFGGLDRAGGK